VEGGDHNEECVALLRKEGIPTVQGNHDEDCNVDISKTARAWLDSLPTELNREEYRFTHITPDDSDIPIFSQFRALDIFEGHPDFRALFIGHLHYPILYILSPKKPYEPLMPRIKYGRDMPVKPDHRYIICVGAVGYPRDGLREIRYVTLDLTDHIVQFIRFSGPLLNLGVK
jgi:hypothetical protein